MIQKELSRQLVEMVEVNLRQKMRARAGVGNDEKGNQAESFAHKAKRG